MCLWPQRVVPFQAEEGVPEQLGQADSQHLFQFLPSLLHLEREERVVARASAAHKLNRAHSAGPYLGKNVPPDCFLGPGLVVESSSSLLLRIPNHIGDDLQRARRRAVCSAIPTPVDVCPRKQK